MNKSLKNILIASSILVVIGGVIYTVYKINKDKGSSSKDKEKNDRKIVIDNIK
jgi:hypothetical protein